MHDLWQKVVEETKTRNSLELCSWQSSSSYYHRCQIHDKPQFSRGSSNDDEILSSAANCYSRRTSGDFDNHS
ncbi:unnamed protein product [Pocillopora meandrina]|uniref:Uncharacterized protein n=1 Tax=Pocillopora meandrina TaxID=46732 RepID=A0AAU9X762_9CNID|nr:unnamed protein product [Pocillopora meandrina]